MCNESATSRFVPRASVSYMSGAGKGVDGLGEGSVLAIPAMAYFGHATAPWYPKP